MRIHRPFLATLVTVAMLLATLAPPARGDETYRRPPEPIASMLEARPSPTVSVSPDGRWVLLVERVTLPPLADLARPMWRLAGLRLDPGNNGRHGVRRHDGLVLMSIDDRQERRVALPSDVEVGMPRWSPDGSRFAFTITRPDGIEIWVGDVASGRARAFTPARVNGAAGSPFRWLDGNRLLCRLVPEDRGPAPTPPAVPAGPVVQETRGRTAPVRTYQDLLTGPHDEARFDWIMTAQLEVLDVRTGGREPLGGPDLYASVDASPDGRYWLVSRIQRPYSYLVPYYAFPRSVEIWDPRGERIRTLLRQPLRDAVPIGGVATGPRSHQWQASADARLIWVEALDGGDPKNEVSHRDRLVTLDAPFQGDGREWLQTEHRFQGLQWLPGAGRALAQEYDRDRRWIRIWLAELGSDEPLRKLIWDRSRQDRYGDPGRPLTRVDARGQTVLRLEGAELLLSGSGASDAGDRPFLARFDLDTLEHEIIWRCEGNRYESVVDVLPGAGRILTRHESPSEPPNYFVRNIGAGTRVALTSFPDPQPQLRGVHRELVRYQRADGVPLSATLYVPAERRDGERLPLVVWAYPREYTDARVAGQVRGSPHRFTAVGGTSHLFLLTQGYAVLDGAAMPVIGDPETANDTFIEQLVKSAEAAIDKAVELGVADRQRTAIGGHSYGAFMTANLLAHSDLFRTGIARSGAYNRTLTPFGFQNERRTFWEAPEIYFAMSPFMHAHRIDEPILLIHGERDNNSGTFPLQSRRLFHAIKGNGGDARLVMLPFESHGYRGKESVLHVLAEMVEWCDRHVKGPIREIF